MGNFIKTRHRHDGSTVVTYPDGRQDRYNPAGRKLPPRKMVDYRKAHDEALARIAELTELLRELLQGEDHSGVWVSEDWFRRAREALTTTLAAVPMTGETHD